MTNIDTQETDYLVYPNPKHNNLSYTSQSFIIIEVDLLSTQDIMVIFFVVFVINVTHIL